MGVLTVIGSGVGAYIMGMAVLSPCPLLADETSGGVIIVSTLSGFICSNDLHYLPNLYKCYWNTTYRHHKCKYLSFKTHLLPLPLQVLAWILFVLTLSYVKVIIGVILRDEGHSALVWCGAVVQLGSLLGAVTTFPVVSVYNYFSSGDPCNTKCP